MNSAAFGRLQTMFLGVMKTNTAGPTRLLLSPLLLTQQLLAGAKP
ncbi:hypothetical protein RKLH11_4058 [Rhodobacteraceae bacterium KLH11]|nr:hypothetical protein RKLH11_4058 [Rhodobacteraceae bacterium KLH11]